MGSQLQILLSCTVNCPDEVKIGSCRAELLLSNDIKYIVIRKEDNATQKEENLLTY